MKMGKYLRLTSALLVLILFIGIATACQRNNQSESGATPNGSTMNKAITATDKSNEPIDMVYVFPGDVKPDEEMVMNALNAKLAKDGVPVKVLREPIPFNEYFDKLNLKLSSGEEFDMFHIMQDQTPYNNYYSREALMDLTDIISKYGPVIKEKIPVEMFNGSAINGRNYIIPTFWVDLAIDNYIAYRKDVLEKYNLDIPKTPEDILNCFRTVRANWDGVKLPIINYPHATYDSATLQTVKLHRAYDSYPFIVKDQFFMIFQDGKVKSWFESPEFKKDCDFMRGAYKDGIIQPDILSVTGDWAKNHDMNGDTLMVTTADYADVLKNNPNATLDTVGTFLLAPEKPPIRSWGVKNCNGVSITSKHPEGPVMFINWLWSSQENYDLYMYGIENTHWQQDPNDTRGIIYIKDPSTNDLKYLAGGDSWIGYIDMVRYSTGMWNYVNQAYFTINPKAINSVAGSFFFDATSLATEYANVQAEAAKVMTPIAMGVQPWQEHLDDAIAQLKTAGLDKLIQEYQKQLNDFLAAQ